LNTDFGRTNDGQDCKKGPEMGWVLVRGAGGVDGIKQGEYGPCRLYTYMKYNNETVCNRIK
jgi:hypothetical protein